MSQPQRSVWSELKRRHVYRVAAVYIAVAFVVWQVADIVVPALELPGWVLKLAIIGPILAFPIALVLAWAYDITPDGVRPASAGDSPPAAEDAAAASVARAAGVSPVRQRLALTAVALAVLVFGGWWAVSSRRAAEPELSEISLAVFPFTVRGNDGLGYLREGLVDLLSRNLSGATSLQPLDPSLMLKITGGNEPDDARAAGQLARSVGAARFIVGSVNGAGGRIRIDAALYLVRDSVQHVATKTVDGDTTEVFDLVDRLTVALLSELATGAVSERIARTAALTTTSLAALKAYLEGELAYRKGLHEDANDAFQRALAADSVFPLARYRLAMSSHMRGHHDGAQREIAHALLQVHRLTPHDRRVIEAFHALHTGSLAVAEQQLRAIVNDFPRDLEARIILAELLMRAAPARAEPLTEARRLLEEVLEADPKFMCIYCQLAAVLGDEGDLDGAERLVRLRSSDTTKLDLGPKLFYALMRDDSARIRDALADYDTITDAAKFREHALNGGGAWSVSTGNFAVAAQLLAMAARRGGMPAARARLAASMHLARGEWRAAAQQLTAYRYAADAPPVDALAATHVIAPPFEFVPDGLDDVRARLQGWTDARVSAGLPADEWPRRLQPAVRLYLLGLTASRMNDAAAARVYADSLTRMAVALPQDANLVNGLARTVRADRALRAGQARTALHELAALSLDIPLSQAAPWVAPHWHAATIRAAAYRAVDDHEAAYRWLRHWIGAYGGPDAPVHGVYHRDMALTLDALGRSDEAAVHHAKFVNAWQYADAELAPQVAASAERLSRKR